MSWLNTIALTGLAFLAVFAESYFRGLRNLLGVQIDLLPGLMAYAALTANLPTVVVLGLLGGFWFDSLSANPLGVSALSLLAVGGVIHYYRALILRERFYPQFLIGLGASAAVPCLTLMSLTVAGAEPLLGWWTLWQWLALAAGGALVTPLCFRGFQWFNRAFNYAPAPESSFRDDREIDRGRDPHADH
jgi:rod shape-determining protein MreD